MEKLHINFINCIDNKKFNFEKIKSYIGKNIDFLDYFDDTNFKEVLSHDSFNIILLDKQKFNQFPTDLKSYYRLKFYLYTDTKEISTDIIDYPFIDKWFQVMPDEKSLAFSLTRTVEELKQNTEISRLQKQIFLNQRDLAELNKIGASLNSQRDIDNLLDLILEKCMSITSSDAGSLYLVINEKDYITHAKDNKQEEKKLHFKISKNMSRETAFTEFTMDISKKSIAGSVALYGEIINIEDVHFLPKNASYSWNKSFDEATGYRTKSMLTVPMKNSKEEIIGVVQLLNKKVNPRIKLLAEEDSDKYVIPFTKNDEALALSLACQAAVALNNARLYNDITNLFEGFIRASGSAIESRDPTTKGHSERVSILSVNTAKAINKIEEGPLANINFTNDMIQEIKYASLLHDFGKIGVREKVLTKAKKLYPFELDEINNRYEIIKKIIQIDYMKKKIDILLAYGNQTTKEHMEHLDQEMEKKIKEIDNFFEFIIKANEPTILEEGGFEKIQKIGQMVFNSQNTRIELLNPLEIQRLSIKKGSLSEDERIEIESHVTHTFKFLSKIPWTENLKNIPAIAYGHHEKLDGGGYPRQIKDDEILIQSKIMAIADIFDALTASDRPYKKALPIKKALSIIDQEVNQDKLDKDIFKIFVDNKIYNSVL